MNLYHLKNIKSWVRGKLWHILQNRLRRRSVSTLSIVVTHPNGTIIDYGIVSRRCVTTAGVNALFSTTTPTNITAFNYHDSGIGTNNELVSDTTLQTPAGPARVTGTQSNPVPGTYRSIGIIYYTTTQNITEHAIFNSANIMWDRSVFAAIGVVSGSSIAFTYDCVANAGG